MDRLGPTGKVSKKRVHLLRWTTFPGRTGRSDRLEFWLNGRARNLSTHNLQVKYIIKIDRNQSKERTAIMLYPVMKILQLCFGYFEYILQSMFK